MTTPREKQLEYELRRANGLIKLLARMVRHYGHDDEMPALRQAQRDALLETPRVRVALAKLAACDFLNRQQRSEALAGLPAKEKMPVLAAFFAKRSIKQ